MRRPSLRFIVPVSLRTAIGRILILAFLIFLPCCAKAWNSPGHMIIAAEAWRALPPKFQKRASELLKHHPEYPRWEKAFAGDAQGLDVDAFVFMRASTWPDEIRGSGSDYDRPHWHFIDYPLKPKSFPKESPSSTTDNALDGIAACEKSLASSRESATIRAVSLSCLIHVIGDIHQPLHCCSLVDKAYPKGDKGGNDFFVKPGERGISLHSLWDGLLGHSAHPRSQWNEAVKIEAEYPRKSLPELNKARTPKDWSLESRTIAIEKAYLRGSLKGSTDWETAPALPAEYTRIAKAVAEKQVALAGYRLANAIEKYLR
ncbi:MAG TPA: S1/P1 nuclease [Verrucomicrobiae bacterium]|jgi:hypothetical protein|nr:S1/P1 nuclease [Verrucomicrobiae bacterium]